MSDLERDKESSSISESTPPQKPEVTLEKRKTPRGLFWYTDHITAIGKSILSILFIGVVIITGISIIIDLNKFIVIINFIEVPPSFETMGFNSKVFTSKLHDQIQHIQTAALTIRKDTEFRVNSPSISPDIMIPDTNISLKSLIKDFFQFFGHRQKLIDGEVIVFNGFVHLTVRINDYSKTVVMDVTQTTTMVKEDIDSLILLASQKILKYVQPYLLAMYQQDVGDLDSAIKTIEYSVLNNPPDADLYNLWGNVLSRQRKFSEANIKYSQAAKINPKGETIYINWGASLLDIGDLKGAKEKTMRAIQLIDPNGFQLDPNLFLPYFHMGQILRLENNTDQAIEYYRKAIELNPKFPHPYTNLGFLLEKKGETEEAIKIYRDAINNGIKYSRIYFNLGTTLMDKGNYEEAKSIFKKGIEIDPQNAKLYYNLAYLEAKYGDLNEAIKNYQKVIEIAPESPVSEASKKSIRSLKNKLQSK